MDNNEKQYEPGPMQIIKYNYWHPNYVYIAVNLMGDNYSMNEAQNILKNWVRRPLV